MHRFWLIFMFWLIISKCLILKNLHYIVYNVNKNKTLNDAREFRHNNVHSEKQTFTSHSFLTVLNNFKVNFNVKIEKVVMYK